MNAHSLQEKNKTCGFPCSLKIVLFDILNYWLALNPFLTIGIQAEFQIGNIIIALGPFPCTVIYNRLPILLQVLLSLASNHSVKWSTGVIIHSLKTFSLVSFFNAK